MQSKTQQFRVESSKGSNHRFTIFLVISLLAVPLMGCSSKGTAISVKPFEGIALRVACLDDRVRAILANQSKAWSLQTGARVELTIDSSLTPKPAADVRVVAPADLGSLAVGEQILRVPDALQIPDNSYGWPDVLKPLYRDKLLVWDGHAYALPLLGSAPLFYYRDDLFSDSSNREAFQKKHGRTLAPPKTWDEFEEIAMFFSQHPRSGLAAGAPSLCPTPDSAGGLDLEFFTIAAPMDRRTVREDDKVKLTDAELFSFQYDVQTGQPRIDQPAFVEALQLLQRLQLARPAQPSPEPAQAFLEGKAVLCVAGSEWLGRFQDDASPIRGRFNVCRVPGSRRVAAFQNGQMQSLNDANYVSYLGSGGWLGVVPRGSSQAEAAFALLAHLSGPPASAEMVLEPTWSAGVFRRSHFKLFEGSNVFGLDSRRVSTFTDTVRQTLMPTGLNPVVLRLRAPDADSHLHILAGALRSALADAKTDAKQTLAAVAQRWRELDKARGEERHRAEYRVSLGLPAQP
jgi:multiple sugar transport system substrate-binding protein